VEDGCLGKYEYTCEPLACEEKDGRTIITCHLVGNFPGSPVDLRFFFKLEGDKIATLDKFSVLECRSAFPVAADTNGKISRSYDATVSGYAGYSDRTSYVIAPNGNVIYAYRADDPDHHAEYTMKAVADWNQTHK